MTAPSSYRVMTRQAKRGSGPSGQLAAPPGGRQEDALGQDLGGVVPGPDPEESAPARAGVVDEPRQDVVPVADDVGHDHEVEEEEAGAEPGQRRPEDGQLGA